MQRGGAELKGAREVCCEDKEEAQGWAGGKETLAGLTGVTRLRGESQMETQRFDSSAGGEADPLSSSRLPQLSTSLIKTMNLLIL